MNESARPLQQMFDRVPRRYDLINRLFTWGLDQRWRRRAARLCLQAEPPRVLDLGCGTGDLALRLARSAPATTELVAADFSEPMLALARRKLARAGLEGKVEFVWADAAELPFADGSFGAVGIAFALRNLIWRNPHAEQHLAEVRRVLAPGGRFVVVESSQPRGRAFRKLVHWYQRAVVARLGGALSGQRGAYRYLARSAAAFPDPDGLADRLRAAGFARVTHRRLLRGVAAVHVADSD